MHLRKLKTKLDRSQLLAIVALFTGSATYAGPATSGGGNSVVCFSKPEIVDQIKNNHGYLTDEFISSISSIEILDLHEAKFPRGIDRRRPKVVSAKNGENIESYIKKITNRLNFTIPELGQILRNGTAYFAPDHIIWQPFGLEPVQDSNQVGYIDQSRCVIATLAMQRTVNQQNYLYIDDRLFNHPKHSLESKAVTLIHEFAYRYAREKGQTDSYNTRLMVASILNNDGTLLLGDLNRDAIALGFIVGSSSWVSTYDNTFVYSRVATASVMVGNIATRYGSAKNLDLQEKLKQSGVDAQVLFSEILVLLKDISTPTAPSLDLFNEPGFIQQALADGVFNEDQKIMAKRILGQLEIVIDVRARLIAEIIKNTLVDDWFFPKNHSELYLKQIYRELKHHPYLTEGQHHRLEKALTYIFSAEATRVARMKPTPSQVLKLLQCEKDSSQRCELIGLSSLPQGVYYDSFDFKNNWLMEQVVNLYCDNSNPYHDPDDDRTLRDLVLPVIP